MGAVSAKISTRSGRRTLICRFIRRYVPAKRLETAFTLLLTSITPTAESIRAFEQLIIKAWETRRQQRLVRSKKARDQLRSLEERKRRLVDMRLTGEIDREEFTKIAEGFMKRYRNTLRALAK